MKPFEETLSAAVRSSGIAARPLNTGECQSPRGDRCTLCHASMLTYDDEIRLKNTALQDFWRKLGVKVQLQPLVRSPFGRNYRTVTKRRVFHRSREALVLGLLDPCAGGGFKPFSVAQCAIEPEAHAQVYRFVQEYLDKPFANKLKDALQYIVVKGNYKELTIILNVSEMTPEVVRTANTLSKSLTRRFDQIAGVLLFEGEDEGKYYLGTRSQSRPPNFRKLFGKGEIYQKILGRSFLFPPLSFSQVNQSLAGGLIAEAGELLALDRNTHLFDLYCGYGPFSICLADKAKGVTGIEVSSFSIDAAKANAARSKVHNARFFRADVTADSLTKLLHHQTANDVFLLDPPRNGTAEGVIECIAARRPRRVVHLFCEIDLLHTELKRWQASKYRLTKATPFDMFPGTSTMEVAALLIPDVDSSENSP